MAPTQRIKVANDKASKNITLRGNVPKSTVRIRRKSVGENFLYVRGMAFLLESAKKVRLEL